MSDQKQNVSKVVDQAAETMTKGVQGMQGAAQQGAQAMQQVGQQMGQAAQDMGRKGYEAGLAGFGEFSRMFGDMKWPMMSDMEALMAAHRRNMETMSAANRVALEGAQNVAKRHMEIVQQTVQEMSDVIRDLTSAESPQTRAAKQADLIKQSYEKAVAHMRELAELIQRSNGEALSMLNKRFVEAMDEVKLLAEKGGHRV